VLTVASLVACTSAPPPSPQTSALPPPPTSVQADPVKEPASPSIEGDRIVASKSKYFRVFVELTSKSPTLHASRNDWGQELWLPVVARTIDEGGDTWYRVLLAERPNGSEGWVRDRDVEVGGVDERVVVRLSAHTVTRYVEGEPAGEYPVAIGASGTPTVPGRFFVWARVGYEDASGPYGNYALGLSGFSEVLTEWPGGGRMAIHGTSDPGDAGNDISHGCVRVFNPQMARLIDVPMGATVVIKP
jgi:lipoprotein-anchoring transpeptidase ErfK/SrfK